MHNIEPSLTPELIRSYDARARTLRSRAFLSLFRIRKPGRKQGNAAVPCLPANDPGPANASCDAA
ncbi:hypothetical protein [Roseibium sp. RKSG952]|uniref:hypothetical protein n=1 Tax=Roseibium sp. RKSG952 TaxID=2529384 RepID=UPI0012BC2055|nr:hypothetical protein [Roseibium sp. RKSG952]MTI00352.1 hypothetical protein [Roseibium sp. RKSG952]